MKAYTPDKFQLCVYISLVFLSIVATIYSSLKPGISKPVFPRAEIEKSLAKLKGLTLLTTIEKDLNLDTSDRTLSNMYTFKYNNKSEILATLVRVRKRDDFKIETYGLLTKNLSPIYIAYPSFNNYPPHSVSGVIENRKSIQTCIIPGTHSLNDADIRLVPLTQIVENKNPKKQTIIDKLIGSKKERDYSCLVLTYKSPHKDGSISPENWKLIITQVQKALSR